MPSRGAKRPSVTGQPHRASKSTRAGRDTNKALAAIPGRKGSTGDSTTHVAHPLIVMPALREVHRRLTEVRSAALTVCLALQEQNADYDQEIAETVRTCVTYKLDHLINRLESILGLGPNAESGSDSEAPEHS